MCHQDTKKPDEGYKIKFVKGTQVTSKVSTLLPEATSYPALISNKQLRQDSTSSFTDATNGSESLTASEQSCNSAL